MLDATPAVFTVKVAVVDPAVTLTLLGTVALVLFEDSETAIPPLGAGPLSVTVPVEFDPPVTEVGETAKLTKPGGEIVRVPDALTEFAVPVIEA